MRLSHGLSAADLAARLMARLVNPTMAFEVYDKQREFLYSDSHHLAFIAGIGSGKSYVGAMRGIRAAYGMIGNTPVPVPNVGVVTAPTYRVLEDATIRTYLDLCDVYVPGFDRAKHYNISKSNLTLPNGSEILFRSTKEPERLRGPSVLWWMGDEAALSPGKARQIMIGRLRQFGILGYEWQTTTPKGRNWVWQVYVRDGAGREDYELVRASSRENVFLSDELIASWELEYTGDFARQELGGEFVAFEGLIYGEFDVNRHVVREVPSSFKRVVAGVDWGFANPGVILVCGVDGDNRVYLLVEEVAKARRVEEWVNVALQLRDRWGIREFYCDPSEPDYIRQFREAGLKAEGADNRVLPGIQRVKNRLVVPPGARLPMLCVREGAVHVLGEIDQYQWAENKYGMQDAPVKANDHTMDALRYAVMGIDEGRKPIRAEAVSYVG